MEPEVLHVDCECMHFIHSVRFHYDPEYGELQVETHLGNWLPWYKRIVLAFKYVFKAVYPVHLQYDCTVIPPKDYAKIKTLIEHAEKFHDKDFLAARLQPETLEKLQIGE